MSGEHAEVLITPSAEQYRQLVMELEALRAAGYESNTAAILDAVHRAAHEAEETTTMGRSWEMAGQRGDAPGPAPGGQS